MKIEVMVKLNDDNFVNCQKTGSSEELIRFLRFIIEAMKEENENL